MKNVLEGHCEHTRKKALYSTAVRSLYSIHLEFAVTESAHDWT